MTSHTRTCCETRLPVPDGRAARLTLVIPCYNEERTLQACIRKVLAIADESLELDVVIVDDGSTDQSVEIAEELSQKHPEVRLIRHDRNQGKGAAVATGFKNARGEFVAIQDADLEYDPMDLRRLVVPLVEGRADVVMGSRFLSSGAHRVLYFWHYMGNRLLTFISNMFTDLNLTDMETCYKVFRKDVIDRIEVREKRFGFEPEIVAKVAHMRLRIFEMGISYFGRTYAEGKKIGVRDGFRALYCVFRYNAHKAPAPIQFLLYLFIGGTAALLNLAVFLGLLASGMPMGAAAPTAFITAAAANYLMCIAVLFRHRARWNSSAEIFIYAAVVAVMAGVDYLLTRGFLSVFGMPGIAKAAATGIGLIFNFMLRRSVVFPEPTPGPWRPSDS